MKMDCFDPSPGKLPDRAGALNLRAWVLEAGGVVFLMASTKTSDSVRSNGGTRYNQWTICSGFETNETEVKSMLIKCQAFSGLCADDGFLKTLTFRTVGDRDSRN